MNVPVGLDQYFSKEHFRGYPKILIPQMFEDPRGVIRNIADGTIGDIAVIESQEATVRADHYHKKDWHLTYLLSGSMKYFWSDNLDSGNKTSIQVHQGELIYTPPGTPHKMFFLEDTTLIAVSWLSRIQSNYDEDTHKLDAAYFTGA